MEQEDYIIKVLNKIYKGIYFIAKFIKRRLLFTLSLIIFLVLLPTIYYGIMFNKYNIYEQFPRFVIFLSVFLVCFLIMVITISLDENSDYKLDKFKLNIPKYFFIFGGLLIMFILFSLFFYISRFILYKSSNNSLIMTSILIVLGLAIYYLKFIKNTENGNNKTPNYSFINLINDIIFFIPCLLIDIIDYAKKDFNDTPQTTFILGFIILAIVIFYYIFPLIIKIFKNENEIKLLKEAKSLNTRVIYISQDELKNKIIENKPYLTKKVLENNNKLKKELSIYKTYVDENKNLFKNENNIYEKKQVFDENLNYVYIKDLNECLNKEISCKNNLITCDNTPIVDYYGLHQKCNNNSNQTMLNYLLSSPEDRIFFYDDSSKNNTISMKDFCKNKYLNSNIKCITYNHSDLSNEFDLNNDFYIDNSLNYDSKGFYVCNNIDSSFNGNNEKYSMIYGYVDNTDISKAFDCCANTIYTEGFNPNIHGLDVNLINDDMFNDFNDAERDIINNAISDKENKNLQLILNKLKNSPEKIKMYLAYYLSTDENYMGLLHKINKYNNNKNEILYQETSELIKYINVTNQITTYNYHYGISFWVYFDTNIMTNSFNTKKGTIFNYGNKPLIYFDYDTKELKIEVSECENNEKDNITCKNKMIYKTDKLLFQKWNNFVVNYNYGTLDIFINNNLVLTKNNIQPYIEENMNYIQFGDYNNPLYNCGLCNVSYYNKPLNLIEIKKIYSKKNNPCN